MRLLTMLATAVLLAACVHDTDDFNLFLPESGASLLYYIGSDIGGGQKNDDDPWDTISESFPIESSHTKDLMIRTFKGEEVVKMLFVHLGNEKSDDDPWYTIGENFPVESSHTKNSTIQTFARKEKGGNDPWDTIGENFPIEKSTGGVLVLKEVRGDIGRFEYLGGRTIFAVGLPECWGPGLAIRVEAYLLDMKTMLPLMGAVVWEVVLSPGPNRFAASFGGPKERGDVAGVGDVGGMADETGVVGGTLNTVDHD